MGLVVLLAAGGTIESLQYHASDVFTKINEAKQPIFFESCVIVGDLNLSALEIEEELHFNHTSFQNSVICNSTNFSRAAFFRHSYFNEYANFGHSKFGGTAYFQESDFNVKGEFVGATFKGAANFRKTDFYAADFSNGTFNSTVSFREGNFGEIADFSNTNFKDFAYFNETTFGQIAKFSDSKFERKAVLIDANINGNFIGWADIKNALICNDEVKLRLIKNLKDHGQFNDADNIYSQYRMEKMRYKFRSKDLGIIWDLLSYITCGYGVSIYNTIWSALVVWFLFGLLFSRDISGDLPKALWVSTIVFLSLPLEWYSDRKRYKKVIEHHIRSATIERLIGMILIIIFISTYYRIIVI